jgi:glycopeptide antibiotics resistance protein
MTANTRTPARLRVLTAVLFAIYLVLLVAIILFKFPFQYQLTASGRVLNLIPFAGSYSDPRGLAIGAVIENVLIFVPLGVDLAMLRRNWSFGRKTLIIAATSVAFEVIQFVFAIGRSDITDVICNTLGGVLGIGVYVVFAKLFRGRTTLVLTVIQLITTVLALAFFTFLRLHSR